MDWKVWGVRAFRATRDGHRVIVDHKTGQINVDFKEARELHEQLGALLAKHDAQPCPYELVSASPSA